MKHSTQLIRSLLGLTVLLASCQVDDSPGILSDSEAQLFVSEACNYYEQTISEAAEKSKLVQNKNMSPGEVTPCWHKAHIKQDANCRKQLHTPSKNRQRGREEELQNSDFANTVCTER